MLLLLLTYSCQNLILFLGKRLAICRNMEKFQNKYRIPSARLQNWDYGRNAAYFITICTENREHFFGEIINDKMKLSEIGFIAEKYWLEIPDQFPYAKLDVHVVMPNHVHGILIIDKTNDGNKNDDFNENLNNCAIGDATDCTTVGTTVETRLIASLPPNPPPFVPPTPQPKTGGFAGNKNPMINENISRIVRWYKGRCSFEIRKIHADYNWQSRFHDHIIRDNTEFERIREYIINNPKHWKDDRFFQ